MFGIGSAVSGQTVSGTLRGTVTDANGAVVPNATVTARSVETGLERTVTTSDEGNYNIPFLPIGVYTVTATRTDFNKVTHEKVTIKLNETTVLATRLDPTISGEVTVTDEAEPINTSNQQIASSLKSEQIIEKPVGNQTNFLALADTFTGFQENPTSGQNNPTLSSGSSINFNGTGSRGATFQINGVNNDDSSENQNRQGAALATIKEFQVISNNFTAEFGRGYGAVVLVQTKSGTNSIDGSVYWFHNDSALNAAQSRFSHTPKPVARRNQFGGVVGFPIFKNKLFGFLSFDHVENSGALSYSRDVFLMSERDPANWFTNAQSASHDTPANRAFIQSVIDRFANAVPNSTRGPRVFEGQQPFNRPDRDYSGRVDWNITSKDVFYARWQYTRQRRQSEDLILGEATEQNNKQQNFGGTWTHIFNSNVVGEFRYGLGLRTTLVNIRAGNETPVIRFANSAAVGGGSIIGNAGSFPIQRYQTDNQFVYNLSWVLNGAHLLKFGFDIRKQKLDDLADNFSRGFYNFGTSCRKTPAGVTPVVSVSYTTGFQALINGCISNYQKGYGPFYLQNRLGETNIYVEDNWKVRRNLTLNLGVRYEYVQAPEEAEGKINYGFGDDKNNMEPRIGFAYSPHFENGFLNRIFGKSGQSSIRGGYGIYHGRIFQSVFSQAGATVRFNPPNARFLNETIPSGFFSPTNLQDPTLGFVFTPGAQTGRIQIVIPDPNLEVPYTQQWNLTVERQLPWSSALRISYTGNRGIGLLKYSLGNLPIHDPNGVLVPNHPNNGALAGQIIKPAANIFCAGTTANNLTDQCPTIVPIAANEYSVRDPKNNNRRPDPRYDQNQLVSNAAWSYYNGLQIEWTKRLSNDLNFQAAYTWSKAIDTTSDATNPGAGDSNSNGPDERVARALSRFHTPHRFTFFGTYRLPFFRNSKGFLGQTLGGWEISAVVKWIHGTPFTVSGTALDLNLDGFTETRPVLLDASVLGAKFNDPATSQQILAGALAIPTSTSQYGCCILGRNTFYLDGTENVDLNLTKRFRMPWEGHSFTLRADIFNAFNHVQFGFPNTSYTANVTVGVSARPRINPLLGQITGFATSYAPRNIQLSLKYSF
jgi:hypothetical protein